MAQREFFQVFGEFVVELNHRGYGLSQQKLLLKRTEGTFQCHTPFLTSPPPPHLSPSYYPSPLPSHLYFPWFLTLHLSFILSYPIPTLSLPPLPFQMHFAMF